LFPREVFTRVRPEKKNWVNIYLVFGARERQPSSLAGNAGVGRSVGESGEKGKGGTL